MVKEFNVYKCKLVKEKNMRYIAKTTIGSPEDVFEAAKQLGYHEFSEEFFGMFTTDVKGTITSYHQISHGDLTSSIVHPREIFKKALLANAAAIILVHNHPSGDVTPSEEDITATKVLVHAGETMKIPVLDHLVIGSETDYYSMKANDIFNECCS